MKIAVKFGDNDFTSTWYAVMDVLWSAYQYTGKLPSSKDQLLTIVNELSYGCYLTHQNQFEYNLDTMGYTREYLKIDQNKLLLNEEVDSYLNSLSQGFDNSSTFILDTEAYSNNIYCV